jgi:hypothetical protein
MERRAGLTCEEFQSNASRSNPVIRSVLPATILSSLVISAALAAPISPNVQVNQFSSNNLDLVGYYNKNYYNNKKYYKHHGYNDKPRYYKGGGPYYYGGRHYGHRYYARPSGWQTLGCFAAGPVWYCP